MRLPLLARRTHKWLALVVGLQVVLWTLTGLYMTAVHIDIIHGDHFVRTPKEQPVDVSTLVEPSILASRFPGLQTVQLTRFMEKPAYVLQSSSGFALVDATSGQTLSPIDETKARALARHWYAGEGDIVRVDLITKVPLEVQTRPVPLWRVEFEGWDKPTFYFSPLTGEMIARRHELWRLFDFMWMFHIMDYDDRTDVNNPLLRTATVLAVLMSATGLWLLLYSFPKRKRKKSKAKA
ncbi:PepSY domain-containing protein [Caulobacter sp. 17J65-9]|uniref:PepSY domain-containing protein n=1 Tax=Caulobacter sp. 17J65-9 TaxID=2709382 RepID=UPI0013CCF57B|nr:PepSY domain-containing protein [Caulobacter sp. 17J65-9]NEX91236.1 hypothetical protein [Caulobacter sp. 17J65-9]